MGLISFAGIPIYRKILIEKRKVRLSAEFKDLLYSISSAVMTGRHLGEAIQESEKSVSLIYGGNSVLALEVKNMCRIMSETNCSGEAVLSDLAKRCHVNAVMDFSDMCMTCRVTGGDMNRMIYKAVFMITQNIELNKEKEVMLSQKKTESRILAAMPIIVTGIINITSPDYMEVMYTTSFGRLVMTAALAGTITAFLWSMKLVNSKI
ncbi:MAG: hypothetical protein HFE90_01815 [Firmicutes bacterium]|nr:hypothetical protein [Bacillota bacterium]